MFSRGEICSGLNNALENCNKADLLNWIEELPVCCELKRELIELAVLDSESTWKALKLVIKVICEEDFIWEVEK